MNVIINYHTIFIMEQQQLQQIKLICTSSEAGSGLYTYATYLALLRKLFKLPQLPFVVQFWRILKIASAGHDTVLTKLVYEAIVLLLKFQLKEQEVLRLFYQCFQRLFEERFFRLNHSELKNISFMKRLRGTMLQMRRAITENNTSQLFSDWGKSNLQLLYQFGKANQYRKSLCAVKKIQTEMKECPFKPILNQIYNSKIIKSPVHLSGLKTNSGSLVLFTQSQPQVRQPFKAKAFPSKLFNQTLKIDRQTASKINFRMAQKIKKLNEEANFYRSRASCSQLDKEIINPERQKKYIQQRLLMPGRCRSSSSQRLGLKVNNRIYRLQMNESAQSLSERVKLLEGRQDDTLSARVNQLYRQFKGSQS